MFCYVLKGISALNESKRHSENHIIFDGLTTLPLWIRPAEGHYFLDVIKIFKSFPVWGTDVLLAVLYPLPVVYHQRCL